MKEKSMRKQNLFVSFFMLLITAVALTTATYAWFSAVEEVQLDGLEVNVEAVAGIQVSANAETWRANITVEDLNTGYEGHVNQIPTTLAPVSTIGVLAGGENEGAFAFFDGVLNEEAETTLTTSESPAEVAGDNGNYVAFDLFILSPQEEEIYLAEDSAVVYVPDGEEESVGLELASRVGFLYQGTDGTSTPATARALENGTPADQTIWEPNARTYTSFALGQGATDGVVTPYYGVKQAGIELEYDNPTDPAMQDYFEEVSPIYVDSDDPAFEFVEANRLFNVQSGISKIRVYIWIEGQDPDSSNAISLGEGNISVTLHFGKATP